MSLPTEAGSPPMASPGEALGRECAPPVTGLLGVAGRMLLVVILPLSLVWLPLGSIPGAGNLTASDVSLVGLWIVTAAALVTSAGRSVALAPLVMILFTLAIGVLAGIGQELSAPQAQGALEFMLFMKRFGLASVVPLAAGLFRSRTMGAWMRAISFLSLAGVVAFTLVPELQEALPRPESWDDAFVTEDRATGALTNPNDLAYASVSLAVLHAAFLPHRATWLSRALLGLVLVGAGVCLTASGSRSGALGASGALLYIIGASKIGIQTKLGIIAAAVATVVIGFSTVNVFQERMGSVLRNGLGEQNVSSRLDAQALAFHTSFERPFGVGYTGFALVSDPQGPIFTLITSDNVYLDTLVAAGFGGLVCLVALFLLVWRYVARSSVARPNRYVLKGGLVAFALFGTATVVPISVFLAPLYFSLAGAISYSNDVD